MPADIVWINGGFAVGKTTVAEHLARIWPSATVVDPELWGTSLHRWTPPGTPVEDFQDLSTWRRLTRHGLSGLVADFHRTLVVPMTLWKLDWFDEVIGGLRADGLEVAHVCLLASRDTLVERCRRRGDDTLAWVTSQFDAHGATLTDPRLSEHLDTDHRSAADLAERIAGRVTIRG